MVSGGEMVVVVVEVGRVVRRGEEVVASVTTPHRPLHPRGNSGGGGGV